MDSLNLMTSDIINSLLLGKAINVEILILM